MSGAKADWMFEQKGVLAPRDFELKCLPVYLRPLSRHIRLEIELFGNHLCHLTMRQEEKKRKFHEAVVNMLFPPSIDNEPDDDPDTIPTERHDIVPSLDDNTEENYSSSHEEDTDDDGNVQFQNKELTRAQRKRIRKKRLEEESVRRGKIIGPLFPLNGDVRCSKGDDESWGVAKDDALDIQNDGKMGCDGVSSKGGEQPIRDSSNKLKQRRAAKRKAKAGSKSSDSEKKDGNVD